MAVDDPTRADMYSALEALDRSGAERVILQRSGDDSFFVRAAGSAAGGFVLEHRASRDAPVLRADRLAPIDDALAAFRAFARGEERPIGESVRDVPLALKAATAPREWAVVGLWLFGLAAIPWLFFGRPQGSFTAIMVAFSLFMWGSVADGLRLGVIPLRSQSRAEAPVLFWINMGMATGVGALTLLIALTSEGA